MRTTMTWPLLLAGLLLAACSRSPQAEQSGDLAAMAPDAKSEQPQAQQRDAGHSMLAYEHEVGIALAADAIPERLRSAQSACRDGRFGQCVVLDVREENGDSRGASLGMRMAPAAVEPMIAMASHGGELGSRNTHAEDLAVAVRDNTLTQQRLRNELARLQEFQQRREFAVADMIALSDRMARTQAELEAAEQTSAQHRRRVDTQKLTLNFRPPPGESGRSEIGQALRDFGGLLSLGTAWTIRVLGVSIPVFVVVALVVLVIRRLRRRR